MQRSAPYLQTGAPQLRSGKYFSLRHEAESTFRQKFRSGKPHFFSKCCVTKRNAAFFPYYEAERRIFSVLRSGKHFSPRIPYRSAARITYVVKGVWCCPALACFPRSKWAAFRSVKTALRPVSTERSAAYFQELEAGFTIEYRVFKNL